MLPFPRLCVCLTALALVPHPASRADWAQFRGPDGAGIAEGQRPPIHFSPEEHVTWKTALPRGASSPCIVGDRIVLTTFEDQALHTVCLSRKDGAILWQRRAPTKELEAFHPQEGSPASATPVSDGERVIVYFGSYGLLAYDLGGDELWKLPLPIPRQVGDFGSGCSPILADGLLLLNRDQLEGANLLAVQAATGQVVWRADRSELSSSFGSPVIWRQSGEDLAVLPGTAQMKAYDLKTGRERWTVLGLPSSVCTTPIVADDLLIFAGWAPGKSDAPMPTFASMVEQQDQNKDGAITYDEAAPQFKALVKSFDRNQDGQLTAEEWQRVEDAMARGRNRALAVRPGGAGDITESHVVWSYARGLPYVASPLAYRGLVYFIKDGGMLTALKATTGEVLYAQERLGAMGSYYASPIAAAGHIYCTSLNGAVTVVKAGDNFEVIARNELGERTAATPAVADNTLYVRTQNHLFAFAE